MMIKAMTMLEMVIMKLFIKLGKTTITMSVMMIVWAVGLS